MNSIRLCIDNHFLQTLLFSSIAKIIIMTKESHNSSFNFILIINIWCFYLCRTVRCLANSSRELLRHCSISQQYTRGYDIALYQIVLFILWIIYKMPDLNGMMREKNIDKTLMRPYILRKWYICSSFKFMI